MHTSYLHNVLDRRLFAEKLGHMKALLQAVDFDAFAVTGNSGTLFGGALAPLMDKSIFLVRKDKEGSHSSYDVEGDKSTRSYLFLDDQVTSGSTRARVVGSMRKHFPDTKFVGQALYDSLDYQSIRDLEAKIRHDLTLTWCGSATRSLRDLLGLGL